MPVRIKNVCTRKVPFDPVEKVRSLLRTVPTEHLVGLDAIYLVDRLRVKKRMPRPDGLYWPKTKGKPARIDIAIGTIFLNMPRVLYYLPVYPKLLIGITLYHEIGHHYQHITHGIGKGIEEQFADKYKSAMIKKAFRWAFMMLFPFIPFVLLLRWILRRALMKGIQPT